MEAIDVIALKQNHNLATYGSFCKQDRSCRLVMAGHLNLYIYTSGCPIYSYPQYMLFQIIVRHCALSSSMLDIICEPRLT